jgi:hypothetical protein
LAGFIGFELGPKQPYPCSSRTISAFLIINPTNQQMRISDANTPEDMPGGDFDQGRLLLSAQDAAQQTKQRIAAVPSGKLFR